MQYTFPHLKHPFACTRASKVATLHSRSLIRSYTIKHKDSASTVGIVLYSRSYYVNKVVSETWPAEALQRGLKATVLAICFLRKARTCLSSY